jgi:spore germination protein YaaH
MKKIIVSFIIFGSLVLFYLNKNIELKKPLPSNPQKLTHSPTLNHSLRSASGQAIKQSIFLPYWSLPEDFSEIKLPQITNYELPITNYIYFGITPDEKGINKNEPGYQNLITKINQPTNSFNVNLLVLRMTNTDLNFTILDNNKLQQKMIAQTIEIAKEYSFSGIVLDLEVSSLPSQRIIYQITDFVNKFSTATKSQKLSLDMTIYGDTFYRNRPYDLKNLRQYINQFYIMAYDFHKALGTPGPNFPLYGRDKYSYDLEKAIKEFLSVIPPTKLTFVFGLYGYDWMVDEKERPIKQAKALILNQIRNKLKNTPIYYNSSVDSLSQETLIKYSDENNNKHILWYEDEKSIEKKQQFLKSKGIANFAYWAWGYY